ncbi:unnamed protein product [Closterium sp. NIES-54]
MESHAILQREGFDVSSYGTGSNVKLPGPSIREPNVYKFGTPYKYMFDELQGKDPELYKRNGILRMLKRNLAVKEAPQKWQDNAADGPFDVVITFEERVFDMVIEDMFARERTLHQAALVINLEVRDTHEEAASGAEAALRLCRMLEDLTSWEDEVEVVMRRFRKQYKQDLDMDASQASDHDAGTKDYQAIPQEERSLPSGAGGATDLTRVADINDTVPTNTGDSGSVPARENTNAGAIPSRAESDVPERRFARVNSASQDVPAAASYFAVPDGAAAASQSRWPPVSSSPSTFPSPFPSTFSPARLSSPSPWAASASPWRSPSRWLSPSPWNSPSPWPSPLRHAQFAVPATRKTPPIGPDYQADIPEPLSSPHRLMPADESLWKIAPEDGACGEVGVCCEEGTCDAELAWEAKWLGTQVWPDLARSRRVGRGAGKGNPYLRLGGTLAASAGGKVNWHVPRGMLGAADHDGDNKGGDTNEDAGIIDGELVLEGGEGGDIVAAPLVLSATIADVSVNDPHGNIDGGSASAPGDCGAASNAATDSVAATSRDSTSPGAGASSHGPQEVAGVVAQNCSEIAGTVASSMATQEAEIVAQPAAAPLQPPSAKLGRLDETVPATWQQQEQQQQQQEHSSTIPHHHHHHHFHHPLSPQEPPFPSQRQPSRVIPHPPRRDLLRVPPGACAECGADKAGSADCVRAHCHEADEDLEAELGRDPPLPPKNSPLPHHFHHHHHHHTITRAHEDDDDDDENDNEEDEEEEEEEDEEEEEEGGDDERGEEDGLCDYGGGGYEMQGSMEIREVGVVGDEEEEGDDDDEEEEEEEVCVSGEEEEGEDDDEEEEVQGGDEEGEGDEQAMRQYGVMQERNMQGRKRRHVLITMNGSLLARPVAAGAGAGGAEWEDGAANRAGDGETRVVSGETVVGEKRAAGGEQGDMQVVGRSRAGEADTQQMKRDLKTIRGSIGDESRPSGLFKAPADRPHRVKEKRVHGNTSASLVDTSAAQFHSLEEGCSPASSPALPSTAALTDPSALTYASAPSQKQHVYAPSSPGGLMHSGASAAADSWIISHSPSPSPAHKPTSPVAGGGVSSGSNLCNSFSGCGGSSGFGSASFGSVAPGLFGAGSELYGPPLSPFPHLSSFPSPSLPSSFPSPSLTLPSPSYTMSPTPYTLAAARYSSPAHHIPPTPHALSPAADIPAVDTNTHVTASDVTPSNVTAPSVTASGYCMGQEISREEVAVGNAGRDEGAACVGERLGSESSRQVEEWMDVELGTEAEAGREEQSAGAADMAAASVANVYACDGSRGAEDLGIVPAAASLGAGVVAGATPSSARSPVGVESPDLALASMGS